VLQGSAEAMPDVLKGLECLPLVDRVRRVSYDCRSSDNYRCRCERLGRLMGGA
jgi:hypothetical protein